MTNNQDFDLKNNDLSALDRNDKDWILYVIKNHMVILEKFDEQHLPFACSCLCSDLISFSVTPDDTFEIDFLIKFVLKISRLGIHSLYTYEIEGFRAIQNPIFHKVAGELYYCHAYAHSILNRPFSCLRYLDTAETLCESYRDFIVKSKLKTLIEGDDTQLFYEWCRLKEAETWEGYEDAVPENSRGFFVNVVQSYFLQSAIEFDKLGSPEDSDYAFGKLLSSAYRHPFIDDVDPEKVSQLNCSVIPDNYEGWCFKKVLFLNFYNEIPNFNPDWCYDEPLFGSEGDKSEIYSDIVYTFDHCRHLLYDFTSIEEAVRFSKKRDGDIEKLVDCYMRLYSLFDKISKIINFRFNLGIPQDKTNFKTVSNELKKHSNRYLKAIVQVGDDLYPTREEISTGTQSPLASAVRYGCKPADIRNCMTHSGFRIVDDYSGTEPNKNLVSTTVMDLEITITDLMYDVREIILLIKLAEAEPMLNS